MLVGALLSKPADTLVRLCSKGRRPLRRYGCHRPWLRLGMGIDIASFVYLWSDCALVAPSGLLQRFVHIATTKPKVKAWSSGVIRGTSRFGCGPSRCRSRARGQGESRCRRAAYIVDVQLWSVSANVFALRRAFPFDVGGMPPAPAHFLVVRHSSSRLLGRRTRGCNR